MRWLPALLLAVLVLLGAGAWLVTRSGESGTYAAGPAAAAPDRPPPAGEVRDPGEESPLGLARTQPEVAHGVESERTALDAEAGEDDEDPEGLALLGRVIDPAGQPVAGATVYGGRNQSWGGPPLDSRLHESMPWSQRIETTTDENGRFRLEGVPTGEARLAVRAPGFAPLDDDDLSLPEGEAEQDPEHDLGELQLEPGLVLWGRVTDPAGYGVAGAEIVRVDEAPMFFFGGLGTQRGAVLATSGADGSFRVDVLAPGPWELMVLSSAHPDEVFDGVAETLEVGGLVFRLAAGASITGRVEGGDLDPTDVVVRASPPGDVRIDSLSGPLPWREVACDAEGRFELGGLEPGSPYRLRARTGDARPWQTNWLSEPLEVPPNARDVVLQLLSTAALSFRPVAEDTEAALTEVSVKLVHERAEGQDTEQLEWDDERVSHDPTTGLVTVTGIRELGPGVTTRLTLEKKGYRPAGPEPFALVEGQTHELGTIALQPRPMMSVRVTDAETGEPVEGAEVELWAGADAQMTLRLAAAADDPFEHSESHDALTGADGIARVPRIEAVDCQLSASASGYADAEPLHFRLAEDEPIDEPAYELVLKRGGTLEVLALEPSGAPARETSVTCVELVDGGEGSSTSQNVDADGVARFEDLSDGTYRARVDGIEEQRFFSFGNEEEGPPESRAVVQVVAGETVRVTLSRPPRGVLSGRVTEGGRGLAGASLRLESTEGQRFHIPGLTDQPQARTDRDGRYRIGPLDAGSLQLVIVHPSRVMDAHLPVELVEGDNELDVELPITVIEGRVTGVNGQPVEGATVDVAAAEDDSSRSTGSIAFAMSAEDRVVVNFGGEEDVATRTDGDGRYQLRGVLADTELAVTASHPEFVKGRSAPLELGPGDVEDDVDLVLNAAGRVEATATRAGAPLGNCVVRATWLGEETLDSVSERTDGQGRARLGGLAPGSWSVQLEPPGWGEEDYPAPQVVSVTAGELARVDLIAP